MWLPAPSAEPGRVEVPAGIVVFAPSPLITVTIEDRGGEPDIMCTTGAVGNGAPS